MRITIDLSPAVHHHAGIGRYTHELVTALAALDHANEYCAFYNAPHGDERPDAPLDRLPSHTVRQSTKMWRMNVLLASLGGVAMDRWLPSCDVFHATDYVLPPLYHAGGVLTIYDLTFLLFKEYHLPLNRWYLSLMLPSFARRADAVIVISNNTRRDVEHMLQIPSEKITVIYLGVAPEFNPINDTNEMARVRGKYKLPPRFILYFGTIEPRKNLPILLEAYHALLLREHTLPHLVLAGRKGWLHHSVLRRVNELGLTKHVHFTEWIDEKDVPALMNAADVFVYPSLYEGFGLPPLEAMACGTPVICANASSLPEVVGDGAILFDPRDAAALVRALSDVLANEYLRAELRARGIAQASRFSWTRAARETLALYESIVRNRNAHRH